MKFERNEELIKELQNYAVKFNDWNTNGVVNDIIDPDRYPEYFKDQKVVLKNVKEINKDSMEHISRSKEIESIFDDYSGKSEWKNNFLQNADLPINIRWRYHWKPIQAKISENFESVKFVNEIPGIPLTEETKRFYNNLEELFKEMLPGFEKLNLVKRNKTNDLQIIIKAQKYRINPGTGYEGKWHLEGVTERIVATGVYYFNVDEELKGGDLEFKNKVLPCLYDDDSDEADLMLATLEIKTGTTVVFSNEMIHRFNKIENTTDKPLERLFINFFIIDSANPLPLGDLENYHNFTEQTLQTRQLIRKALVSQNNDWNCICYGNDGDFTFIPSLPDFEKYSEDDMK